ncbi:MAG: hypothetical protein H6659_03085 [Ardenticatenaceae bacterium]|nr:hypothetical protein [Ardenticatenaceae bacterium]MCB8986869.1 hypothetical protein [Ardenticatenaceae bacterium]
MDTPSTAVRTVRWVARIWSLLSIVLIGAIFVGQMSGMIGSRPSPSEWVGLAFFPLGVLVGLGLGWWREDVGGVTAVLSLFAFYIWDLLVNHSLPGGIFFLLLTAPAFLYLFVWRQTRLEGGD